VDRSTLWVRRVGAALLGVTATLAVAAAWIPFRNGHPNLDLALALVLLVMAVGALGSVAAALVSAAAAAWWFDFFATRPYGHPAIAGGQDLATFAVLAVVGAAGGAIAARATANRRGRRASGQDLLVLRNAAGLLATRNEPMEILSGIVLEVGSVLGAAECEFSAEPAAARPPAVLVSRDGSLQGRLPGAGRAGRLAVPVWAQGDVVGHIVAAVSGPVPSADRLGLAVTLSDQAGAVLVACGMAPLPPDQPPLVPRLRVVDRDPVDTLMAADDPPGTRNRASDRVSA
jgi:hypothetical protein